MPWVDFLVPASFIKPPVDFFLMKLIYIKEGEEECFDREVASTVQEPEETCDLHPMKTCKESGKNKLSIKEGN